MARRAVEVGDIPIGSRVRAPPRRPSKAFGRVARVAIASSALSIISSTSGVFH